MKAFILIFFVLGTVAFGADELSTMPSTRQPVSLGKVTDPFADVNASAPAVRSGPPPESKEKAFSAIAAGLHVTTVVLTNDPVFRTVCVNHVALKQGQTVPPSLFTLPPEGPVVLRSIEPDKIVLSTSSGGAKELAADSTSAPGAKEITAEIAYQFTGATKKKKK